MTEETLSPDQQSDTLTTTWLANVPPVLRRATQLTAIPYWFDQPMLAALRGPDDADGRTPRIADWLSQRSFISRLGQDRYVFSTDMRNLLRLRWTQDRQGFAEANRRLADYFAQRLAEAKGIEADELKQSYIYHLLAADGDAGIAALQQAVTEAESTHRLAVAERLVEVAAEQRPFLAAQHAAWLTYLQARTLQLHNRWANSASLLQPLLDQPDLASNLRPRVQALLANALIETNCWTQAIELYEQALKGFEINGLYDEVAACQLGLGYAHMDLGLNVWGQRESRPTPPPSWKQTLLNLATLPARLPVLLYVLFGVHEFALLPAWLTLARDVDWTIVRLFIQASHWYHLALRHMEAARNTDGILRAKDSLARLYLAMGFPAGAAELYHEIIERTDIATSEYQMAYARAWWGLALLRLGRAQEAAKALNASAPVLAAYGDKNYAGRAYSHLAEAQLAQNVAEDAVASYATALDLMREPDNLARVTDVAHNLERIAVRGDVNDEVRTKAKQLATGIVQRRYPTRYCHAALDAFHRVFIATLAVVLFVTLYLATRTESEIVLSAGTTLTAQVLSSPSGGAEPSSSMTVDIKPSLKWQANPQFRANVAMGGLLVGLLSYLVTYTVVGVYVLLRTTPHQLEERPNQDVQVDAGGLECGPERIAFADVTGLVRDDWKLQDLPLATYSETVALGSAGRRVVISGRTAWYSALTREIAARIPPTAQRVELGTSLTRSAPGILLIANVIYLALFVLTGYLAPDLLSTPLPFLGHYALADLRVLIYLGLLIPLVSWLVIVPLRARVFFYPRSRMPWGVIGVGLGLAGVSFINLGVYHLSLGRPDIIVSLLAVWLVWIGAAAIYRSRWARILGKDPADAPAYPWQVRWAGLALAVVVLIMAAPLVIRELVSYDDLLTGNAASRRGDSEQAIAAYTRALQINPNDASAHAGLGVVYSQKGDWAQAIAAYQASLQINPRQSAVWSNLGLAYEGNASALDNRLSIQTDPSQQSSLATQEQASFDQAIAAYTRALELQSDNIQYLLRRGVVYSALGQMQLDKGDAEMARKTLSLAAQDFGDALKLAPKDVDAYIGMGWAHFKLGESYYDSARQLYLDPGHARKEYEIAASNFYTATQLAPQNPDAKNGLGWANLKLGDIEAKQNNRDAARPYYQRALDAYAAATAMDRNNPQYAVSAGNARWLVSTFMVRCTNPAATDKDLADYTNAIQLAIADIERGAQQAQAQGFVLDQTVAFYYRELGQLGYIMANCRGTDTIEWYKKAIAYYDKAIAAEPTNADYAQLRGRIGYVLAAEYQKAQQPATALETFQRAYVDLASSNALRPNDHTTVYWQVAVGMQLANLQRQDTAEGLAQREAYCLTLVADATHLVELAQDTATRQQDAYLAAVAYLKLGWTYYLQGKYEQAVIPLDKGIAFRSDYATLYFVKGLSQLAMGDEADARQSYTAGLDAASKMTPASRAPALDDAIGDLQDLGKQKPALQTTIDQLIKSLQAAK